ncbi:MAG: phage antirepressor KilAC domain-containing protein [Prevotella sp.]|nr:phage antirepressor KilAC domain-containing protein [Prevotella sp.]
MHMELQIYENAQFGTVRTTTIDGEIMFVGKDVADILGYTNAPKAIKDHVDDEDKLIERIVMSGQNRDVILINESGLYCLILSSKKPKAREFKHWVTAEVLPAIRKHGMYAMDEILDNPDLAIAVFTQLKEERERRKELENTTLIQRQQIAQLQPKASYYDLILQNTNTFPITQIAKDYGMSGRKFNALLHELGIQYKFRKTWLLYQNYADQGYTQSKTHQIDEHRSVMHTYWTQKGRIFLYDILKNEGILPLIEIED